MNLKNIFFCGLLSKFQISNFHIFRISKSWILPKLNSRRGSGSGKNTRLEKLISQLSGIFVCVEKRICEFEKLFFFCCLLSKFQISNFDFMVRGQKCGRGHENLRFWNSSADSPDSPDSADSPETVSAAADQAHPNHAQES